VPGVPWVSGVPWVLWCYGRVPVGVAGIALVAPLALKALIAPLALKAPLAPLALQALQAPKAPLAPLAPNSEMLSNFLFEKFDEPWFEERVHILDIQADHAFERGMRGKHAPQRLDL